MNNVICDCESFEFSALFSRLVDEEERAATMSTQLTSPEDVAQCDQQEDGQAGPQKEGSGAADIVFHGGNIFTLDDKNPRVEALAVKGERILEVGNFSQIQSKIQRDHTKVVDLQGKTLLPGFIEAHTHALLLASGRSVFTDVAAYGFDGKLRTKDDMFSIMKKEISDHDLKTDSSLPWCMFAGWDIELIPDLPQLTADFLDKEFTTKFPLLILAQNLHAAWVNHKMLEVCNITCDTIAPKGGVYVKDEETNKLTGLILEEPAISSIVNRCPKASAAMELARAITKVCNDYASKGFTTVTEMAYMPNLAVDHFLSVEERVKHCPVRLALYTVVGKDRKANIKESSKLWMAGYKFWADGSPHAGTAATAEDYLENDLTKSLSFPPAPNKGHLNWSCDDLLHQVTEYHEQGKQVAIHAHGERAIDQALDVYAKLLKPGNNRRHRLEHVGLITEEQLKRCSQLGVTPSFFVDHLRFYGETLSDSQNGILGPERTDRWAPVATAIKHIGAENISIHQDHPGIPGPLEPFANMKTAITRTQMGRPDKVYGEQYRITIDDAIKAYTIGPAYQLFREHEIGSLEVGKYADLVVLSTNPYEVDPMKLDTDVQVVETYTGGRWNSGHP